MGACAAGGVCRLSARLCGLGRVVPCAAADGIELVRPDRPHTSAGAASTRPRTHATVLATVLLLCSTLCFSRRKTSGYRPCCASACSRCSCCATAPEASSIQSPLPTPYTLTPPAPFAPSSPCCRCLHVVHRLAALSPAADVWSALSVFINDAWPITFMAVFAVTNGYIASQPASQPALY